MRRPTRLLAAATAFTALTAGLMATSGPAGAITGGTPDTDDVYSNVAMITFYADDPDAKNGHYRYRCTGTLVSERVILTAAHCTDGVQGDVLATFAPEVATTRADAALNVPRASDDLPITNAAGDIVDWTGSEDGFAGAPAAATGRPTYYAGTGHVHPDYSNFTDMSTWNDVGVVVLDDELDVDIAPAEIATVGYLDKFRPSILSKTLFTVVGYGTVVAKLPVGPQKPTPTSYPLVRRVTESNGQKLTPQILQTNGNEHNVQGGGGTCFGDSGGPAFHQVGDRRVLVTVTSYGYTDNCRYIDGLQRVDIPGVHAWVHDAIARPDADPESWSTE